MNIKYVYITVLNIKKSADDQQQRIAIYLNNESDLFFPRWKK